MNKKHKSNESSRVKDNLRENFIGHYYAVCAAKRAAATVHAIETDTPTEGVVYRPRNEGRSPDYDLVSFSSMEAWSENRLFVSYYDDCTIRLYGLIDDLSNSSQRLPEIASLCIDPSHDQSQDGFNIHSMTLTRDHIECLLKPYVSGRSGTNMMLCVIGRDEFLLCKISDASRVVSSTCGDIHVDHQPSMTMTNIRHALVRLLSTCGDKKASHLNGLKEMMDRYNHPVDFTMDMIGDIAACGDDVFVLTMEIEWRDDGTLTEGDSERHTSKSIVFFSATSGKVVSIQDCYVLVDEDLDISIIIHAYSCWYKSSSLFAVGSGDTTSFVTGERRASTSDDDLDVSLSFLEIPSIPRYNLFGGDFRSVAVLQDCVVSAESWSCVERRMASKMMLSYFRRPSPSEPFVCESIPVVNSTFIHCVYALGDKHIGVCSTKVQRETSASSRRRASIFDNDEQEQIIYEVSTGREVCRVPFEKHGFGAYGEINVVSCYNGTVGVCINNEGIGISSKDVRYPPKIATRF
jgi:hypothetical protein